MIKLNIKQKIVVCLCVLMIVFLVIFPIDVKGEGLVYNSNNSKHTEYFIHLPFTKFAVGIVLITTYLLCLIFHEERKS